MPLARCVCAEFEPRDTRTRLALVMHHRELAKTTSTGPLAMAALQNSELFVHGLQETPLDLSALHDEGRRVLLLFPREAARVLDRALVEEDPRPVTLVVPDGNWRQATRASKRIPGLADAIAVTLPDGPPTRWGVRRETRATGLATFEAIARAFGILEGSEVQVELEGIFERVIAPTRVAKEAPDAPDEAPLRVLYRDEHLVAIDKPSGLLVHRGWGNDERPAVQRLRDQLGAFVYPVHRLDRATSGVLLFALSSEVAADTQALFARQAVDKRYLALCRGQDQGLVRVDRPLAKPGKPKRPALTEFRLLGVFERYGLYEARPRTGTAHQIRKHLKNVSHPIIGDVNYGKGEHNRIFRERFGFGRLALHCASIEFVHPRTGDSLRIEAPIADDFAELLAAIDLLEVARGAPDS